MSASGVAAGVYQYLTLFLVWYLFEDIELVVKVVIENDYVVILFHFLIHLIGIGDTLAGRACKLEIGVVLADIVLQQGRIDDTFVKTVICNVHHEIAELVAEVFLFELGVSESKAEGYALAVEILCNALYEFLCAGAALEASAVPYGRREHSVE